MRKTIDEIVKVIEVNEASMIAIDSFKAIHELAETASDIRGFAYNLCVELVAWRCISLLVGEYTEEDIYLQ